MLRVNPLVEPAGRAIARHDDLISAAIRKHVIFSVEPQVSLAAVFLGAMAGKAVVGKNGTNVTVEVYRLFGRA